VVKNWCYNLLAERHRRQAIQALRTLEYRLPSPSARFAIPFVYRGPGHFRSIRPRQTPTEIEKLYQAVGNLRPSRVLEIGTAKGGTLYLWAQAADEHATIISIDLPGGPFGGGYPTSRIPFYQSFARSGQRIHLLREDSHSPGARDRVVDLLAHEPLDFLFIDGDHTYNGIRTDFQLFAPLCRPGGLIAFHDICPAPHDPAIQVSRFWSELRDRYPVTEWIGEDNSGRRIGIGLFKVPSEPVAV
jgi:predicted O-methyltransferase YrrM